MVSAFLCLPDNPEISSLSLAISALGLHNNHPPKADRLLDRQHGPSIALLISQITTLKKSNGPCVGSIPFPSEPDT
eukprot:scaffold1170_cov122-Cylindrotheca_fusiformis.AAC.28